MGVALVTNTPSDPVAKFLFLIFCWPKGLSSKGRNASSRRYNNSIELEVKNATQTLLMCLNQQAKKWVAMLVGVIDPDNQREVGLLLHSAGKEEDVFKEIPQYYHAL